MIPGNDNYPGMGEGRKVIVQFFQLPEQGLAVEEIPGDQKKIRLILLCHADDPQKAAADCKTAFLAPGHICIGRGAQMDVCRVN